MKGFSPRCVHASSAISFIKPGTAFKTPSPLAPAPPRPRPSCSPAPSSSDARSVTLDMLPASLATPPYLDTCFCRSWACRRGCRRFPAPAATASADILAAEVHERCIQCDRPRAYDVHLPSAAGRSTSVQASQKYLLQTRWDAPPLVIGFGILGSKFMA